MNEKVLFITHLKSNNEFDAQIIEEQSFEFVDFYKRFFKSAQNRFVLKVQNPKLFFKKAKKTLPLIKAAGGLVENDEGDFLFIYRNKRWDLPKGKIEKGEKVKTAAQREVEEECGLKVQENLHKIINTYHLYTIDKEVVLKKTSWYKMRVKGVPKLIPQVEEGITKAEWLRHNQFRKVIKNTYPLIKDVLEKEKLMF